ncbi:MAG: CRISPR-associated endonuclease Cas6 [Nitrospirae bacterium]|nr:CRISPR-associated endonuclease Cas6 [Nitrospirota bacterium]
MQIKTIILSFECDQKVKNRPDLLRGYFASRFEKYLLMHQHDREDKYLYRYPLVQYKILDGKLNILGIREGAELLNNVHKEVDVIDLNGQKYEIFQKTILIESANLSLSSDILPYSFLTPWLALNEKNYEKYQRLGSWPKKKEMLESILIGNIISMSKSLRYTVPEPIKADIKNMKEVQTKLKGTPMLGFLGTFSVNFEIPDYWGIGKSVSRGFGTVKRVKE